MTSLLVVASFPHTREKTPLIAWKKMTIGWSKLLLFKRLLLWLNVFNYKMFLGPSYVKKSCRGKEGHPPSRVNLNERLYVFWEESWLLCPTQQCSPMLWLRTLRSNNSDSNDDGKNTCFNKQTEQLRTCSTRFCTFCVLRWCYTGRFATTIFS